MTEEPHIGLKPANQPALPWYDRSTLAGMVHFEPDQDGFTVILTSQAIKDLKEGTSERMPNEAYGHLMGRTYADDKGCFTVVSGVVYADDLNAGVAHVKLTAEQMGKLRRKASRKYPTADFVGWTHSHRGLSGYSPVDFEEQQTWTKSYNIGILTFMETRKGEPWAIAYRGPDARRLRLVAQPASVERSTYVDQRNNLFEGRGVVPGRSHDSDSREKERKSQEDLSSNNVPESIVANPWSLRRILLFVVVWPLILCLLLILILGIMLHNLSGNVAALQSQLNRPSPVHLLPASTSLLWNCTEEAVMLQVVCNGPIGPDIHKWTWNFGDGKSVQNTETSIVTHIYKQQGTYTVSLTITTSFGQQVSSSKITIGAPLPSPTPVSTRSSG